MEEGLRRLYLWFCEEERGADCGVSAEWYRETPAFEDGVVVGVGGHGWYGEIPLR